MASPAMGVLNSPFHFTTMLPTTDTDIAFASIEEIARLFRKRKLSPVEPTKLIVPRIDQHNPKNNTCITATSDLALAN